MISCSVGKTKRMNNKTILHFLLKKVKLSPLSSFIRWRKKRWSKLKNMGQNHGGQVQVLEKYFFYYCFIEIQNKQLRFKSVEFTKRLSQFYMEFAERRHVWSGVLTALMESCLFTVNFLTSETRCSLWWKLLLWFCCGSVGSLQASPLLWKRRLLGTWMGAGSHLGVETSSERPDGGGGRPRVPTESALASGDTNWLLDAFP